MNQIRELHLIVMVIVANNGIEVVVVNQDIMKKIKNVYNVYHHV